MHACLFSKVWFLFFSAWSRSRISYYIVNSEQPCGKTNKTIYHLKVRLGLGLSDKTSVVQYNMHGCLGPPDYRRRWYWPQYRRKWNLSQCWLVEKHGVLILWMTFLSDYFSFIRIHWTATVLFVWCWPNWNLKGCDIYVKKKNGINRVDMTAHDCPKGTVFDFHLNMCMPVVCEQV